MPGRIGNIPGKLRHYRRNRKNDEEMAASTIESDSTNTESAGNDGNPVNDGPIQVPPHGKDGEKEEEEEPQMNIMATLVSFFFFFFGRYLQHC